jgi:hypothetical protein
LAVKVFILNGLWIKYSIEKGCGQNIDSSLVFISRKDESPTNWPGFFISTSIRAGWKEHFGNFFGIEIGASLLGISCFGGSRGVDRERQGSGIRKSGWLVGGNVGLGERIGGRGRIAGGVVSS